MESSTFFTVYFLLTGFRLLHVVLSMIILVVVLRARAPAMTTASLGFRGDPSPKSFRTLRAGSDGSSALHNVRRIYSRCEVYWSMDVQLWRNSTGLLANDTATLLISMTGEPTGTFNSLPTGAGARSIVT